MTELTTLTWPAARFGEALEALARTAGLGLRAVVPLPPFIPHPNPLPEGEGTKNLPQKAWGRGEGEGDQAHQPGSLRSARRWVVHPIPHYVAPPDKAFASIDDATCASAASAWGSQKVISMAR